jgi:hypothetical protein
MYVFALSDCLCRLLAITSSWLGTTLNSRVSSGWTTCQATMTVNYNSRTSPRTRTEIMIKQNTPMTETVKLCISYIVLCLFKLIAHVWRWAECLLCFFPPWHFLSHVINLLSLPSPYLFIWHLGAGGWTWHMESQEFGS